MVCSFEECVNTASIPRVLPCVRLERSRRLPKGQCSTMWTSALAAGIACKRVRSRCPGTNGAARILAFKSAYCAMRELHGVSRRHVPRRAPRALQNSAIGMISFVKRSNASKQNQRNISTESMGNKMSVAPRYSTLLAFHSKSSASKRNSSKRPCHR